MRKGEGKQKSSSIKIGPRSLHVLIRIFYLEKNNLHSIFMSKHALVCKLYIWASTSLLGTPHY